MRPYIYIYVQYIKDILIVVTGHVGNSLLGVGLQETRTFGHLPPIAWKTVPLKLGVVVWNIIEPKFYSEIPSDPLRFQKAFEALKILKQ